MKFEVKLFANFREFLPPGNKGYGIFLDMGEEATVGAALKILKIPDSIPMLLLVNGIHKKSDDPLNPGDVLSVFPPVAGG